MAVVLLAIRGIRSYDNGGSGPIVLALVIAGGMIGALLLYFGVSNARRIDRAQRAFPSAWIVPVLVAPLLAQELSALTTALGLAPSRVNPTRYATLVVDDQSVQFLSGRATGSPAAAFPSNLVRSFTVGSVQIGMRIMATIEVEVASSERTLVLPVTPMRSRGNWLRAVPDADIARLAEDLRRAIGAGGI
ncbi:hypothetical protein [Cryobacterium sp. TMT2-23]|uniref:hypothetical protein n=1 Tax=Cryobacterium sp. TMT2-23 TaxID=1259252 RepID=UPI00106C1584|nr:hypothetical protein [Cryobacterium sp. TMT2-23]TFD26277.1 hypothetical protein E3T32_03105 [Cryobacterium sp. TMT2-23]